MTKVRFGDGQEFACLAVNPRGVDLGGVPRAGIDILFTPDTNIAELQAYSQQSGVLDTVTHINTAVIMQPDGEPQTVEVPYVGYTRPVGVGTAIFDYLDVKTHQMTRGICAFISASQPSEMETLKPQIALAVAAIDDQTAINCLDLFEEWSGNGVVYAKNDRRTEHGILYKCLQNHTSQPDWCPCAAPSLWVNISNPGEEYPLIDNPISAGNPWMLGQKGRTADGSRWVSLIDNNVWQPEAYPQGWEEQK